MTTERLKIAVFVDFDNIEIGVKTTLGGHFDIGIILEAIKERGEVVTKVAYGDWTRAGDHSRLLTQHAIRLVQRNLTPGGDKNGADINLALDALEMVFTHQHINAFVIVGGDSDFITLVEKLKQYDKKVFVIGGRAFTSVIMQRNCHEFIAYENLIGTSSSSSSRRSQVRGRQAPTQSAASIAQAFPLVRRALKLLSDREVSPQLGLLKSTLLQLDSTFSERSYGAGSFRDFAEKLEKGGLVNLKQTGRSVLVELKDTEGGDEGEATEPTTETTAVAVEEAAAPTAAAPATAPAAAQEAPAGEPLEAVRIVQAIFQNAAVPRWPMYIRNVKQIIKANDPTFDERRYGFTGILDFLRSCQREGLFRLERDRNGGVRVFPAAGLQQTVAVAAEEPSLPLAADIADAATEEAGDAVMAAEAGLEAGAPEAPEAIDTEAAAEGEVEAEAPARKPRRTRKTAGGAKKKTTKAAGTSTTRKTTTRKPRARKPADSKDSAS